MAKKFVAVLLLCIMAFAGLASALESRKLLTEVSVKVAPAAAGKKAKSGIKLKNFDAGYFGSPWLPYDWRYIMGGLAYPNVILLGRGSGK